MSGEGAALCEVRAQAGSLKERIHTGTDHLTLEDPEEVPNA